MPGYLDDPEERMRIYIAGRMRGEPQSGYPLFDAARDLLRSLGHDPISPADMDRGMGFDGFSEAPEFFLEEAMRRDIAEIIHRCDAIALLPNWTRSTFAPIERAVAWAIGLGIYEVDPWLMTFEPEGGVLVAC